MYANGTFHILDIQIGIIQIEAYHLLLSKNNLGSLQIRLSFKLVNFWVGDNGVMDSALSCCADGLGLIPAIGIVEL